MFMEIPKSTMGKNIYITTDELKSLYRIINGATIYKGIKEPEFPKQNRRQSTLKPE